MNAKNWKVTKQLQNNGQNRKIVDKTQKTSKLNKNIQEKTAIYGHVTLMTLMT